MRKTMAGYRQQGAVVPLVELQRDRQQIYNGFEDLSRALRRMNRGVSRLYSIGQYSVEGRMANSNGSATIVYELSVALWENKVTSTTREGSAWFSKTYEGIDAVTNAIETLGKTAYHMHHDGGYSVKGIMSAVDKDDAKTFNVKVIFRKEKAAAELLLRD